MHCPGTSQVINPVDMFILKRKTWGRGLSGYTPDNGGQLSPVIHPLTGLVCALSFLFCPRASLLSSQELEGKGETTNYSQLQACVL